MEWGWNIRLKRTWDFRPRNIFERHVKQSIEKSISFVKTDIIVLASHNADSGAFVYSVVTLCQVVC